MPTEKKLLPENIQIPTPQSRMSATGLLGFANTLPECPSRLPDGTILDYSAVDETWKDVDFPERAKAVEGVEVVSTPETRRAALEESIFSAFHESNQSHVTPAHILKHVTRVQSLASLVPSKAEEAKEVEVVKFDKPEAGLSEMVAAANAILEKNDLVIEAADLDGYAEALEEALEYPELSESDRTELQELFGTIRKVVGAGVDAARKVVGGAVSAVGGAASKVGQAVTGQPSKPDADESKPAMKKWKKRAADEMGERSPEARANRAKRREIELGMTLSKNKQAAQAAKVAPKASLVPPAPSSSAKTWSKKGSGGPVHNLPGYFSWRAKKKAADAV